MWNGVQELQRYGQHRHFVFAVVTVLLCNPIWLHTHFIDQGGLKLKDLLATAHPQVLELKVYVCSVPLYQVNSGLQKMLLKSRGVSLPVTGFLDLGVFVSLFCVSTCICMRLKARGSQGVSFTSSVNSPPHFFCCC